MNAKTTTKLTLSETIVRLRLIDDEMMRVALQDQIELVQFILRIIMGIPDLTVIHMETQKDLMQIGPGRSLSLDVLAVDSDGTQYDLEIQRASRGAQPHRPRYHLSLMDSVFLRQGDDFDKLPKAKIIFITEHDCIGSGELMESFVFRNDKGRELKTDQEIIYLNTAFEGDIKPGDEGRAALAHDFLCSDPAAMKLVPLADRMRFLKDTERGRAEMGNVIQQYAKQEADKATNRAMKAKLAEIARSLFNTGKLTPQEIADSTGLSIEDVHELCEPQQV